MLRALLLAKGITSRTSAVLAWLPVNDSLSNHLATVVDFLTPFFSFSE